MSRCNITRLLAFGRLVFCFLSHVAIAIRRRLLAPYRSLLPPREVVSTSYSDVPLTSLSSPASKREKANTAPVLIGAFTRRNEGGHCLNVLKCGKFSLETINRTSTLLSWPLRILIPSLCQQLVSRWYSVFSETFVPV